MTVGGSHIEGAPALNRNEAQFYTERCYLDQVSLGQLLDLYQYREGKEESALARFVNELLGLEQLDALRFGLADADDIRRLKKLSDDLANTDADARDAASELTELTEKLSTARDDLTTSQDRLVEAMRALGHNQTDFGDAYSEARTLLQATRPERERSDAAALRDSVSSLGGRIESWSIRPSTVDLNGARDGVTEASVVLENWRRLHGTAIDDLHADLERLNVPTSSHTASALSETLAVIDQRLTEQSELAIENDRLETQLAQQHALLRELQDRLSDAQERAGSLAEGLAALREHASDDVCPVCDRAFGEVSTTHLTIHIDRKITELTNQGRQLQLLRAERDNASKAAQGSAQNLEQLRQRVLDKERLSDLRTRRAAAANLRERVEIIQPLIDTMHKLETALDAAETRYQELEFVAQEASTVHADLQDLADQLGVSGPLLDETLQDGWRRLARTARERAVATETLEAAHIAAEQRLRHVQRESARVAELKDAVAAAAVRKATLEARVQEAKRRQSIAKEVQQAASLARTEIVHRVFTRSLNDVWQSVFTRLAPREDFIPAFGIPTTSKSSLALTLETVHRSGMVGGSPQLMLSAGNLNTAALSLFIALHLAVEPLIPCLVFDDPVQSMDEVHVAQFAGLVRVLAKQHGRQVIIAVHERELFEYLALELSPAFEGDELITIQLDPTSEETRRPVQRIGWSPDPAIAV
ncbi:hypothetical protein ASE48_13860 [Mycobacterium sp. Root265]|nr:hypothetical protein ASE48_13860 [Mycobacterium sp. Root265]